MLFRSQSPLAPYLTVREENAGLHFLLEVKTDAPDEELTRVLEEAGVRIFCVSQYCRLCTDPYRHTLVAVSYTHLDVYKRQVYELVERFFGASLAAFSHPDAAAGEFVPQCECLDVSGIDYVKARSSLPYRTAIVQYADAAGDCNRGLNLPFLDWLCKNRYNRILTWARCYEELKRLGILTEAERRGLRFTVGHHDSSKLFLPPHGNEYFAEHYYETHPEYYKLQKDGTRYEDTSHTGQWVFCSRSDGLIETLADNIICWIKKNPLVDIIAFWPNDGIHPQCTCPQCSAYTKVENCLLYTSRCV